MAREKSSVQHIDNLSIYAQSYKATLTERGVTAHAYLEPINDDTRRGYQLDLVPSRESGSGKLGPRQEEIGEELKDKLRVLLLTELHAAGWYISGQHDGKDVWKPGQMQDKPKLSPETEIPAKRGHRASAQHIDSEQKSGIAPDLVEVEIAPQPPRIYKVYGSKEARKEAKKTGASPIYTRPVSLKRITFVCERCGNTVAEDHLPGAKPKCCKPCAKIVRKEKTLARVKNYYATHPDKHRGSKKKGVN